MKDPKLHYLKQAINVYKKKIKFLKITEKNRVYAWNRMNKIGVDIVVHDKQGDFIMEGKTTSKAYLTKDIKEPYKVGVIDMTCGMKIYNLKAVSLKED